MVYLKDIAEIRSGIYLNTSPGGEIAYLQMKDLTVDFPEKVASRVEYRPRVDKNLLKKGDLLFAGKGTTYLCTVFDLDIQAVASTTLYVISLRNDKILPEFLCWYLNLPTIADAIMASQIGSSTPLIHKSTLENIKIPVPDKKRQKLVVEISKFQKRETDLLNTITQKRTIIVNQLLINEINK